MLGVKMLLLLLVLMCITSNPESEPMKCERLKPFSNPEADQNFTTSDFELEVSAEAGYNPCCSFPCQHGGICMELLSGYECDCYGLEYFGKDCQTPVWRRRFKNYFTLSIETKLYITLNFRWLWAIINRIPLLHRMAMMYVYSSRAALIPILPAYNGNQEYTTLDVYYNKTLYARALPPVPHNCPTPLGIAGQAVEPSVDAIYERVLRRRWFKPDPFGSNILFITYAQYFTDQIFKTDHNRGPRFNNANEGVDVSQVYGQTEQARLALRSMKDGKMKMSIIDGQQFPPYLEDCPGINMLYPNITNETLKEFSHFRVHINEQVSPKFAFGHYYFSASPFLFVLGTLWLREHNRVCDILKAEHPNWDDNQLYETGRLIIAGEMIQITLSEYAQHLSQYHVNITYEPDVLHKLNIQYSNRIHLEFNHMYHWHSMIPDYFTVKGIPYQYKDYIFSNNSLVFTHGLDTVMEAMVNSIAGEFTYRNTMPLMEFVSKKVIKEGREERLQSYNNYRKEFGFKPYTSFLQMTGDSEISQELEDLYKDVDAVELFIGAMVEKNVAVTPPTLVIIAGAWAISGMMANPINSPTWWKPSTFGGNVGMNIIKTATLHKLICNNMKGQCENMRIAFTVPQHVIDNEMSIAAGAERDSASSRESTNNNFKCIRRKVTKT